MFNSLRNCIRAWKTINAPSHVLDWITNGIPLLFNEIPNSIHIPNKRFCRTESEFIDKEISRLLKSGCIRSVTEKPYIVSPIKCVPKKGPTGDKLRLIVDLRYLNDHIDCDTFSQEGIDTVCNIIKSEDHMVTIDFEKGFHHVAINKDFHDYLGIYHKGVYYVYQSLCFGLKCSPYYFHKILRPVVEFLRNNDLRIVLYVDDCLLMSTIDKVTDHTDFMLYIHSQIWVGELITVNVAYNLKIINVI